MLKVGPYSFQVKDLNFSNFKNLFFRSIPNLAFARRLSNDDIEKARLDIPDLSCVVFCQDFLTEAEISFVIFFDF